MKNYNMAITDYLLQNIERVLLTAIQINTRQGRISFSPIETVY